MPGPRSRIDFHAVAQAALAAADRLVPQWLPGGKRAGHEWRCGSLAGDAGDSLGVNLRTGAWADFATDERGGDLISLYAAIRGIKPGAAARELAQQLGIEIESRAGSSKRPRTSARAIGERRGRTSQEAGPTAQPGPPAASAERESWTDAGAWPPDGPPAPAAHVVRGKPQASWRYVDAEGRVLGYVHRFVTSTGGKEILPCVWSRHPQRGLAWRWRAFSEPRPLYRLDALAARPDATVLVVEGEKCADAAQAVLGDRVVATTWPGGCKAWSKARWDVLAGRKVILWPDVDAQVDRGGALLSPHAQPGMKAMLGIGERLQALGCDVRLVEVPEPGKVAPGYDVADLIAEHPDDAAQAVLAWLRRLRELPRTSLTPYTAALAQSGDDAPAISAAPWIDELIVKRGEPVPHVANVALVLGNDERWREVLAFDEFGQVIVKRKPPPYAMGRIGEWEASDDTRTSVWLARAYGINASSATVAEAVEMIARERPFHPVREYLRSLQWDGVRRLDQWLIRYVGADDCDYVRAVGRYFLRGMVRRVMEPGCKFDYCLVLEGEEGLRKSSLAETLGCGWGSDTPLDLTNNRETSVALHGRWVIEFAEMESVTRAEAHLQKSFLSRRFDQYRPFYTRRMIKVPRQCVFVGTTNESEYIKEGQGARRFWPIRVPGTIDIEGLRRALPALLAEAVADYDAGERCFPDAEEQAALFRPEQMARVQQESLVDVLHDWVIEPDMDEARYRAERGGIFSLADAAYRCLHVTYAQLTRDLQTRIGKALAALGCERVEKRNGTTRYWYKPPQKKAATSGASMRVHQPVTEDDDGIPF
jgi:predicted P-loop ATPase